MYIATFRLHTASLHQAMRSTGYALPYNARCSAVIGWFSTAVIGACFCPRHFVGFFPRLSGVIRLSCCCVFTESHMTVLFYDNFYDIFCCSNEMTQLNQFG